MGDQPDLRQPGGFLPNGVFLLAAAQDQVDSQLLNSDSNEINSTDYLLFKNDEVSFCRDNMQYSLAIPRPEFPISKFQHQGSEDREFGLTQLTSDTESYMCMLKRRNRTWTVKLRKCELDSFWFFATSDLKTPYRDSWGVRRCNWLKCPRIPKLEREPIAYQVCEHGIAPAGFMMEYIPPVLADHVRALANSHVAPSIRKSVKNDPNVENVRFQMRLGEDIPPDEALNAKLLSRPVYLDQLRCQNRNNVRNWIDQMGASLAILHWACKLDGVGVEFHLAPKPKRKNPVLWMTHFGDCQTLEGEDETTAMAEAFFKNQAWPRPGSIFKKDLEESKDWGHHTWLRFMEAYSSTSGNVLRQAPKTQKGLPFLFLVKVMLMTNESKAEERKSSTD
ncbi:uncharacterized protein FTOL_10965 [Fusarium torulosum]|uniref:DUF3669 domain-containing protein n=1 Tax=Fusarium torulosum TaxID=33205 RepID=A0AAE8MH71_9HYPO|nr:uncharacterized protein FTOL_10965 [Fusarium torulosum]